MDAVCLTDLTGLQGAEVKSPPRFADITDEAPRPMSGCIQERSIFK